jgi:hypothetical protein
MENNNIGVTIERSVISGNESTDDAGGGISLYSETAPVTITDTTISGNTAADGGGGVYIYGDGTAPISIYSSTISGNTASDGWGGGLYSGFQESPVSLFNSTVSGNTASEEGGGISFNGYYGLSLVQSTITANSATTFGGLYIPGALTTGASVSGREGKHTARPQSTDRPGKRNEGVRAHSHGHAGAQAAVASETTSTGTIIAGNQGTDIGPGSTVHSDHSLLGTVASGTTIDDKGGTLLGANPLLGPLADNGGPTQTHALLTGSPAINASTNPVASFTGNAYDQRGPGFVRVADGVADIGAFEVQPPAGPVPEPIVITPKFTG